MRAPLSVGERPVLAGWRQRITSRLTLAVRRWLLLLFILLGLTVGAGIVARPHLRAWYHRRAAREDVQRYHNISAIRHLLICRGIWPRDPETLLLSARAARRAQLYQDAERLLLIYQQARGRDEAHAFELLLLATECRVDEHSEQCGKYVQEGRFDAPLLMEALARGYLRQYRLGQARFCLDHWKQMQPDNPQLYCLEGLLNLDYLHASPAAVDSYRRAVELDADHEEARSGLAIALLVNKDFPEAAEQFQYLRQCQPDNPDMQMGLAECLDNLGNQAEAERLVDEVLARQPHFPSALSLRGQFAFRKGQLTEAEHYLRQALRGKPTDHRARYDLIRCLEQSGQEEEARRQQKQFEQTEQDLVRFNEIVTKEIAQRPTDPALHCTMGRILLRGGQREEGLRWLHSALKLDANYAPAQKALAEATQSKPRP